MNAFRLYGTSNSKIQENIRFCKEQAEKGSHFKIHIEESETRTATDGSDAEQVALYARIEDQILLIGFANKTDIQYIRTHAKIIKPLIKGGDIIIRGMIDGKEVFKYEPLSYSLEDYRHNPFDLYNRAKHINKYMSNPNLELVMEKKYWGVRLLMVEEHEPSTVQL